MFFERIRLQYRIHLALAQAKRVNVGQNASIEKALAHLQRVLSALKDYQLKHPFLKKIFRWIDRRFCILPLNQEIERLQAKIVKAAAPILAPKPPLPLPTPIKAEKTIVKIAIEIPETPLVEPAKVDASELVKASDAFKEKYDDYFSKVDDLEANFKEFLQLRPIDQTITLLKEMDNFFELYQQHFEKDEFFDDMICRSISFEKALRFFGNDFSEKPASEWDAMTSDTLQELMEHKMQRIPVIGRFLLSFYKRQLFINSPEIDRKHLLPALEEMHEELDEAELALAPKFKDIFLGYKLKAQMITLLSSHDIDLFSEEALLNWCKGVFFQLPSQMRKKFLSALDWHLKSFKERERKIEAIQHCIQVPLSLVDAHVYETITVPKIAKYSEEVMSEKIQNGINALLKCHIDPQIDQLIAGAKKYLSQNPSAQSKIQCMIRNFELFKKPH